MRLEARVEVAERGVEADVTVGAGRTLALLGPNGSGKSTALEAIAGVVRPGRARIVLDGRELVGSGRPVPPRDRGIVLLAQDDALFPMSVLDNVAFGPRAAGRRDARRVAEAWLERVGCADLASRRPGDLSGGQARRVAIARALAAEPRVLLLDEPFAGLDVEAASAIRTMLRSLLADVTAIITTHDVLDAHTLADDVAVMAGGRVVEAGTATEVLTRPRTPFAARMAARVLVAGTMRGGALELEGGVRVPVSGGPRGGEAAAVALPPSAVVLAIGDAPRDRSLAWVPDAVRALEPRGDEVRVVGAAVAADVDAAVAASLDAGAVVWFGVPRGHLAYALTG
ncbi:ATP-binding cassette domain-containing protein [Demequina sp. SYSU T00192]|uniref:ATP-binding cassette domain-containing protein n=1 Tax=Demequina litoralis TaxID=3051660 RepID=A0ABT8GC24_9MICO|nr:ATP-binding cassette domain-containing protein [Demequina sp. SYSU T00192]MDN4476527.1 ATP-binding cassette domain-containing protein [Demequina sp. SYSU T00192]